MSDPSPDPAEERRARRRAWPIRRFALAEEPPDGLFAATPAERLAMVWPLTLEAWRVAGLPIPEGRIQDMPSSMRRLDDTGDG